MSTKPVSARRSKPTDRRVRTAGLFGVAALSLLMLAHLWAQGLGPNESWSTQDQAARRGLNEATRANVDYRGQTGTHAEFGGWIYRTEDGRYGYTTPRTSGDADTIRGLANNVVANRPEGPEDDEFTPRLTSGEEVVGVYHIHTATPGFEHEHFSSQDLNYAERFNVPIYLRTPGEEYLKYDPDEHDPSTFDHDEDGGMERFRDEESRPAHAEGEPHLGTHDGRLFDFHAAGEFVAIETAAGDLRAMLRFEPYVGLDFVSVVTGVAVAVAGHRAGVYATPPYLLIDGHVPQESVPAEGTRLVGGLTVAQDDGVVTITTESGDRITVRNRFNAYLDTEFAMAFSRKGTVRGLLGDFDDDPTNDFQTRAGAVVDILADSLEEQRRNLYAVFAPEWRVTAEDSILDYIHGKTASDYFIADFPRTVRRVADLPRDAAYAAAAAECERAGVDEQGRFERCIFDIVVSGETRFVESYREEGSAGYVVAVADNDGVVLAGRIDTSGDIDRHRIDVREPGQVLFFLQERFDPSLDLVSMGLFFEDGSPVARKCFGCGSLGLLEVETAGTYYFQAGGMRDTAMGDYTVRYWYVPPPQQFALELDALIASDQPGPGAGRIERPGATDEYRLRATAGTALHVRVERFDPALDLVTWQLVAPDGSRLFQRCFGCGAEVEVPLAAGGEYVLRVGTTDREAGIGEYRIALSQGR